MRFLLIYIALFTTEIFWAQTHTKTEQDSNTTDTTETEVEYYIITGDTVPTKAVYLDEVLLLGRLKFKDNSARRRYLILRRKTRKVYPYAKLAADRFVELNQRLDSMETNGQRRRYMRIIQRYVKDEFGDRLKKLSRTEGQILVKLINRQTGITTFDLIKEYRNGWKAFWLNTTASLFDISLKEKFDPETVEEDYLIEDILERAFQEGALERQRPAKSINFMELVDKWGNAGMTIPAATE